MNDVRQYCSSEGQRTVNEEQIAIDTRWNQLHQMITDKVNLNRNEIKDNNYSLNDDITRCEEKKMNERYLFSFFEIKFHTEVDIR